MTSQLKTKIVVTLLACSMTACVSLTNSAKKNLFRDAKKICKLCNENSSSVDSTIVVDNFVCVFKGNKLQEAGEIKDGIKLGKWYTFSEECRVKEVIKFRKKGKGKVIYRSSIVNESW